MPQSKIIVQELLSTCPQLATIDTTTPYNVTNNYFALLPSLILTQVLSNNCYTVPIQYFETLTTTITHKINVLTELQTIAPTLATIPNHTTTYKLPKATLSTIKLPHITTAKVVHINRYKRKFWLYATSAVTVIIISITVLNFYNKPTLLGNQIIAGTNVTYNQIQQLDVDAELSNLNTTELNNYLCNKGIIACTETTEPSNLKKEMEALPISDEELNNYFGEATN